MEKLLKFRKLQIVYYPFLLSTYPFVSLYTTNIRFIPLYEILIGIFLVWVIITILWLILFRITNNFHKSALIITIFFILFFSFGHILPTTVNILLRAGFDYAPKLMNQITWKQQVILVVWIVIFIIFLFLINRVQSDFRFITTFMNMTSLVLLFLTIFVSTRDLINQEKFLQEIFQDNFNTSFLDNLEPIHQFKSPEEKPDIYYIILDGYGRDDILNNYYSFDNHEILSYLYGKGFYIATESHSNYAHTVISLASSMNMKYMDDVAQHLGILSKNPAPLVNLIQSNRLINFLNNQDYSIVAFESSYSPTELLIADQFLSPGKTLTAFQSELINITPLKIWLNNFQYDSHRQRTRFIFDHLPIAIQTDQPTFVFAHIISPHPPFVFGKNGERDNPDMAFSTLDANYFTEVAGRNEYVLRYRNQVIYLNTLIKNTIDQILSRPGKKPIIIIQGDHGPGSRIDWNSAENSFIDERMSILNAYYFPDQDYSNLYPEITPVNTFRVILDQYLGTNLGITDDRVFFSLMATWYDFIEVK